MADQPLTPPRIYLIRMAVFLVLAGFVAFILYRQIWEAFQANPGLNALILGVMFIGIVLAIRQVWRLFPEARWVKRYCRADPANLCPLDADAEAMIRSNTGSDFEMIKMRAREINELIDAGRAAELVP